MKKKKENNFLSLFKHYEEESVPIVANDNNLNNGYEYLEFMCKHVRNKTTGFNSNVEPMTNRVIFIISQLNNMGIQYQLIPFAFSDINSKSLNYRVSDNPEKKSFNVHVIFPATNPKTKKTIIFTAHHDIANSRSENCQDNTASVCNLLHLCKEINQMPKRKRNIHIVFTDCEEIGGRGAQKLCDMLHENKFGDINVEGIIGLELTAVGSQLWIDKAGWNIEESDTKLSRKIESLWNGESHRFSTPFNECMVIRRNHFDSFCIGILPKKDVDSLNNKSWSENWRLCHSPNDTFDNANKKDMAKLVKFMKRFVNE